MRVRVPLPASLNHAERRLTLWAEVALGTNGVTLSEVLTVFIDCKIEMPFQAGPVHEVKANLFRVLGHPARVRILELLRDGERSVGSAAGRARARLGRHVAASRGVAADRAGDLAPRRQRASTTASTTRAVFDLLAAGRAIISRRLATEQSLLHALESE